MKTALLLMLSCVIVADELVPATGSATVPLTLGHEQLFNFLYYTNEIRARYGPQITSETYEIPSVAWVRRDYAPYLRSFLIANGVTAPAIPENNCVRFSTYGLAAGYLLHYKKQHVPKTSLAIGIVDYAPSLFEWHSVNFFVAHDKGKLVIIYFEPQTQRVIPNRDVESNWWAMRI